MSCTPWSRFDCGVRASCGRVVSLPTERGVRRMAKQQEFFRAYQQGRDIAKRGFAALAGYEDAVLAAVAGNMPSSLDPSAPPQSDLEASTAMQVPLGDMRSLSMSLGMLSSALYAPDAPFAGEPDSYFDMAFRGDFMREEDRERVARFVEQHVAPHATAITTAMVRDRAADAIIPRYSDVGFTSEIRLVEFAGSVTPLPVSMVYVRTDVNDQYLVFQMTLRDACLFQAVLGKMIERLGALRTVDVKSEASDGTD